MTHAEHHHHGHSWRMSMLATLHCLTGCAIGEVLGMVIGTAVGLSDAWTIALAVTLAFAFGYLITSWGLRRAGMTRRQGVRTALQADTVSIATMEVVDNLVMVLIPGAMAATLAAGRFWWALALALFVAYWVALPVNHWLIGRGKGHAVAHSAMGH